mmetsp:Transcript_37891/g.93842  ORF Transcript_37891/g.93842 Transcript_37891/m.93842 type:complete len:292 (+) Transcript_37891:1539-2414(+)
MVGGLVQQQQPVVLGPRGGQQQARQGHAHLPAAAEVVANHLPLAPGEPEAVQHGGDSLLGLVAPRIREFLKCVHVQVGAAARLLGVLARARLFRHLERLRCGVDAGHARAGLLVHGELAAAHGGLLKVAHLEVAGDDDGAVIHGTNPRHALEEGALAAAVAAHEPHHLALHDGGAAELEEVGVGHAEHDVFQQERRAARVAVGNLHFVVDGRRNNRPRAGRSRSGGGGLAAAALGCIGRLRLRHRRLLTHPGRLLTRHALHHGGVGASNAWPPRGGAKLPHGRHRGGLGQG